MGGRTRVLAKSREITETTKRLFKRKGSNATWGWIKLSRTPARNALSLTEMSRCTAKL